MPGHDIIVVGASAGGVEALTRLIGSLPEDLPAAVFVVLHISPHGTSVLPTILGRVSKLCIQHAIDSDTIHPGNVYVAPPDRHMLIRGGSIRLSRGPAENATRPAIDPLFRSAASSFGRRAVGIVLSGVLDDGTAGMVAIKRRGGIAIVQDPEEALFDGMPRSVMASMPVDYVLRINQMGPVLIRLANEEANPGEGTDPMSGEMHQEIRIDDMDEQAMQLMVESGPPSALTCPQCNGALWETHDGELVRYRCRVGHAYSAETLLAEQSEALEAAMWQALRALKESAALACKLADRAEVRGNTLMAERYKQRESDTLERAQIVRQALLRGHAREGDLSALAEAESNGRIHR